MSALNRRRAGEDLEAVKQIAARLLSDERAELALYDTMQPQTARWASAKERLHQLRLIEPHPTRSFSRERWRRTALGHAVHAHLQKAVADQ